MKSITKKIVAALLSVSLLVSLTACGTTNSASTPNPSSTREPSSSSSVTNSQSSSNGIQTLSAGNFVASIQNLYAGSLDADYQTPLYNISPDHEFVLDFEFNIHDIDYKDALDLMTVYTDADLTVSQSPDYSITTHSSDESIPEGHSRLTIKPSYWGPTGLIYNSYLEPGNKDRLVREDTKDTYIFDNSSGVSWGYNSEYYLSVNIDTKTGQFLEKPQVTIFTVENTLQAPYSEAYLTDDGRVSFRWQPIEGATKYIVGQYFYNENAQTIKPLGVVDASQNYWEYPHNAEEGEKVYIANHPFSYIPVDFDSYEDSYIHDENYEHKQFVVMAINNTTQSPIGNVHDQRDLARMSPYARDFVGDREGALEAGIETGNVYFLDNVSVLPIYRNIIMATGETETRKVLYDYDNAKIDDENRLVVTYRLDGTPFTGEVVVLNINTDTVMAELREILDRIDDEAPRGGMFVTTMTVETDTSESNTDSSQTESSSSQTESSSSQTESSSSQNESSSSQNESSSSQTESSSSQNESSSSQTESSSSQTESSSSQTESSSSQTESSSSQTESSSSQTESSSSQTESSSSQTESSSSQNESSSSQNESSSRTESSSSQNESSSSQNESSSRTESSSSQDNTSGDTDLDRRLREIFEKDSIYANSALSAYLAVNMIAMNDQIDISSFSEAVNTDYIFDAWLEALNQNPLVIGARSVSYNPNTRILTVSYEQDAETVFKKQDVLREKAKNVVAQIITPGMSDLEKEIAINEYLCDFGEYNYDALDSAAANDFYGVDAEFYDSFNAYGILVDGVGVCASYAASFKLLAEEADLDCIVIVGNLNGTLPHAWNRVNINGNWHTIDSTNNDSDALPNVLFNVPDSYGSRSLVEGNEHLLDSFLHNYSSNDNSDEYYRLAENFYSLDQVSEVVNQGLLADGVVLVRTNYDLTDEQFVEILSQLPAETDFDNLYGGHWLGLIFLSTK